MVISNNIDGYHLLKPSQYRHISDFRLTRAISTGDATRVSITFEVRDSYEKASKILKYYFEGCWDIKLGNIASLSGIYIKIEEARSQFFEHVRFKVFDVEEGAIEFLCEDFAVETA